MRVRHKPWAKDYLATLPFCLNIDTFDFKKQYANKTPLALEIGVGKGDFLKAMIFKFPETTFLGVELNASVLAVAAEKLSESPPTNFNIINADALLLLPLIPDNAIDYIILNHSDPWPKKRHEKRRLTHPKFVDEYFRVLKKGGVLILKTDNDGLAEYSYDVLNNYPFKEINYNADYKGDAEFDAKTEYENKFTLKGVKIKRIVGKK